MKNHLDEAPLPGRSQGWPRRTVRHVKSYPLGSPVEASHPSSSAQRRTASMRPPLNHPGGKGGTPDSSPGTLAASGSPQKPPQERQHTPCAKPHATHDKSQTRNQQNTHGARAPCFALFHVEHFTYGSRFAALCQPKQAHEPIGREWRRNTTRNCAMAAGPVCWGTQLALVAAREGSLPSRSVLAGGGIPSRSALCAPRVPSRSVVWAKTTPRGRGPPPDSLLLPSGRVEHTFDEQVFDERPFGRAVA